MMIFATEVTNWPLRILLTIGTIGFMFAMFGLMWLGWKKKQSVQAEIAEPMAIPADFKAVNVYAGRYLASTAAGAWLTRIVSHELGVPSRARLLIGEAGIAVEREGAKSFFIPLSDLIGIRPDRAIAGKAYEKDGIAVITWNLAGIEIDSGFRADKVAEHLDLLAVSIKEGNA